jgi:meiotically up-regulated gene 157 (Mug157) protein
LLSGYGSPSIANGLVRSAFRPSDDATVFQLLIPANAMLSVNLDRISQILNKTNNLPLISAQAEIMSQTIRTAIMDHAIINSTDGQLYAYEIDGFGSVNFMDDANVPSLMSLPYLGFVDNNDAIYTSTRNAILSPKNPYWFHSPSSNHSGIGGPHRGLNRIWPMNWIVQVSTSTSVDERVALLNLLKTTTSGKGLIHENFDVGEVNGKGFGRSWFAWGNSLFGEVLMNMAMEEGPLGAEILFGQGQSAFKVEEVID